MRFSVLSSPASGDTRRLRKGRLGCAGTLPQRQTDPSLDSQQREKYPFATVMPGQDLPEGLAIKADTLAELAAKAGIDA